MDTLFDKLTPSMAFARFFAVIAIAVVFIWFGGLTLRGTSAGILDGWISGHPILKSLSPTLKSYIAPALGGLQMLIGIVVALHAVPGRFKQHAYMAVTVISIGALSLMFTNPVWIKSLGGFPAIGAGQGIIKYLAIAGVALWLGASRYANAVMLLGLMLVLGWIGAMKFTAPEANGVYPLLTSSPLFSWWAPVYFSKQVASNIIGGIELVTVFCLTGWWWNKRIAQIGLFLSALTFLATLSFMITFKGAWTGGFPYLASAGNFLLKDLLLLAATVALLAETRLRP
jgi:reactive chlorine resistance protein C